MMRRTLVSLLCLGMSASAWAVYDIDQLMGDLATHKGGRARFVETRHMAVLDKPVQSSGEMLFTPPDRLEKRTLSPKTETVVLDKDTLSLERDRRKFTIQLSSRPEAQAFVESIRSTLAGNRKVLEKNYALELAGDSRQWVLTLVPTQSSMTALLKRITLSGSGNQLRHIEYQQADGDRSEIHIDPVEGQ